MSAPVTSVVSLPHPLPSVMTVRPWEDSVVEAHGFGPRSDYVEHCWLPLLGPSATWCYRRLGTLALTHASFEVDVVDLSLCLGLGRGLGRQSLLARTILRLARFGALRPIRDELMVRRALAPLTEAQLPRLSLTARGVHNFLTDRRPPAATPEPTT